MRITLCCLILSLVLAACTTTRPIPAASIDSGLVGRTLEITTAEGTDKVRVEAVEDGMILTEDGETIALADIEAVGRQDLDAGKTALGGAALGSTLLFLGLVSAVGATLSF